MRIYVPAGDVAEYATVRLSEQKAHHLIAVLRARKGDGLTVFDGMGTAYEAIISEISKNRVLIDITREIPSDTELRTHIVLCAAILKGEKMDLVVQKATELGVMEIQPLVSERTIVKATRRLERWCAIAEESCEQCGRTILPLIREPRTFKEFFASQKNLSGFVFREDGGLPLAEAHRMLMGKRKALPDNQPWHVVIGPEGGMTAEEVQLANSKGLVAATLGRRILRAETASIVALGLVCFLAEE
ncbi:MAG TPA: 16S rRNA (uracil(1498)-N(3))-methyltransferase [Dissulfurispiraceae bacterium]|nr:16S rRNA (uracil(1498)-N(3))-methyltransferase [Dissulfurispiraceae bacterium]